MQQTTENTDRESPWPFTIQARVIAVPQREARVFAILLAVTALASIASVFLLSRVAEEMAILTRAHSLTETK